MIIMKFPIMLYSDPQCLLQWVEWYQLTLLRMKSSSISLLWVFSPCIAIFFSLANVFVGLIKCLALWMHHMPSKWESPERFPFTCCLSELMCRACQLGLLQAMWNIQSQTIHWGCKCWQLWENNLLDNKRESHPVGLVNAEWTVTKLLGAPGYVVQSKPVLVSPHHPNFLSALKFS